MPVCLPADYARSGSDMMHPRKERRLYCLHNLDNDRCA
jgi:hypothetical protein